MAQEIVGMERDPFVITCVMHCKACLLALAELLAPDMWDEPAAALVTCAPCIKGARLPHHCSLSNNGCEMLIPGVQGFLVTTS